MLGHETLASLTAEKKLRFQGDTTKTRNLEVLTHLCSTTGHWWKDFALASAVRTNEARHVLNDTDYWSLSLLAKVELLPYISQGHLLWSSDNDCPGQVCLLQVLYDGNMLI